MEINNLLNKCMQKLEVKTDYQLAKKMNINSGLISMYRASKRIPDSYACFKIAEILEIDEKCLIAHFEGISAKNETTKEFWKKKLAELGGIAASIFFAVTLQVTSTPSEAAPVLNPLHEQCILC